ncbi:AbrB/MazE/SpoVT family DNA-binding domain-containing protein [Paenibacillus nanensis]|uniref:AbrB/MazE/SpoVT family DNA-binding domain-containing protein n=1 Tax=Paenibacillus nanensis TaxID=393251 RepID=A0A3A1UP12_9BACL|nr:AbrB/MazE/SpoVT family DNA-binding domain-containing protein [Paenibacillus nanensis]RIX48661.1 AbrB/MazE/SpoVT family DNA-binding domain-containing protein [Paenibacillus nanensis]
MVQNGGIRRGMIYMTKATVRKWGNSLAVRIPQEVSELVKFADGVGIEMIVTENKELVLRAVEAEIDEEDPDYLRALSLKLREECEKSEVSEIEDALPDLVGDEMW